MSEEVKTSEEKLKFLSDWREARILYVRAKLKEAEKSNAQVAKSYWEGQATTLNEIGAYL